MAILNKRGSGGWPIDLHDLLRVVKPVRRLFFFRQLTVCYMVS